MASRDFGDLLRRHRASADLTQEQLAERSGLSIHAISMLERVVRRVPRAITLELLARALMLDAQQTDAFLAKARRPDESAEAADSSALLASLPTNSPPSRAPLPAGSRMPLAPNPLFVGRGEELLEIAAALRGGSVTVALGQVVASTGLGGLGKTQLAVELVHRYGRFFAGGVFWLSFASADEIPLEVAACAGSGAVGLEADSAGGRVEERVKVVTAAWQSPVPRLLVFDGCEDESLLDAWRPSSGGCRVLVTSRRSRWSPTLGVTALPLDLLPRSDSVELLRRYRPALAPDDPGLDAIAGELGDLPLALHLAGSYLQAYHAEVSLDGYLGELRRSEVVQHASLLGDGLDDSPSPTHHLQSVAQTFALCLGRLDRTHEVDRIAIALLARTAAMAPAERVPRDLLFRTMEGADPLLLAGAVRRLGAVGLVEEGEGWLRLHRLVVHFVRQEDLDPGTRQAVSQVLISCGEDAKQGHLTGPALAAVIPHLVDAAGAAGRRMGDEWRAAELCVSTGEALRYAGDLRAARPWYDRALAIRERTLGPDHPDTATSLNKVSALLWAQGELADARPYITRALDIRERVLGPDHPDTAESLHDLGVLLWAMGELVDARPHFERALAIRERILGPDHPDTGQGFHSLGVILRDLGDLAAARPLFERAISILERVLGPDHPHTAYSVIGIARLLHAQGELDAARARFEQALDIRERVLGPDHPITAESLIGMALLLRDQGDPTGARPLLERTLAIRDRVLGPDHPDTVATRRALATLPAEGDAASGG